ncbi:unnamed protein product [Schistosoma bovis]|uniref:Ribonuclease n=7 Tax=Schistosoma TaxID=6181 RepID=A0A183KEZ0_9TREM|nr:unnamed protein product [Schistosoma mattheei]CAH8459034.1 unnamed protein product [Schistosoma intercalatum]CAH8461458.1 unnamed protein product [Schistosoma bovis]CAH8462015.1 unnamed protein product [Schistosoma curassoni]CAH8463058.1 unnamed protein product [Schistosoma margrebowiei]CAH8463179.1 unnamed protein product [Schistosoma haematobium]
MALVGPKCSVVLLLLSVWGILMLLLMGVFARVNSVAFSEDIPLNETAWAASGYAPLHVEEAYVMVSNNCFIAAGIYVVLLIFSGVQYYFNKRANYLAH